MDEQDLASDREEIARQAAIDAARQQKEEVHPNGRCQECNSILVGNQRWCDSICRDDWQAAKDRGG